MPSVFAGGFSVGRGGGSVFLSIATAVRFFRWWQRLFASGSFPSRPIAGAREQSPLRPHQFFKTLPLHSQFAQLKFLKTNYSCLRSPKTL